MSSNLSATSSASSERATSLPETPPQGIENIAKDIPPCKMWDDIDHRVFLVTNERDQEGTLDCLIRLPLRGNTLIGVSGFFLLNLAAIRGTELKPEDPIRNVIVFDRSARVRHFWEHILPIVKSNSSRIEVIQRVKELLRTHQDFYYSGGEYPSDIVADTFRGNFSAEITKGLSWLSDEIRFQRIQRIFNANRFAFVSLDLTDSRGFEVFKRQLTQRGLQVDTLYLSNTYAYITDEGPEKRREFFRSLERLVSSGAFLVDARSPVIGSRLVQRVWQVGTEGITEDPFTSNRGLFLSRPSITIKVLFDDEG